VAAVRLLVSPDATPRRALRIAALVLSASLAIGASAALIATANAAGNPSPSAIATSSSLPDAVSTDGIVIVPLPAEDVTATPLSTTQFPTTSPSNNVCPARSGSPTSPPPGGGATSPPPGGGTTSPPAGGGGTTSPSISPSVLGVTFDNPPPNTAPRQGGGLPFTGLPLTHLLAMATALVGSGLLLARSGRSHYAGRHTAG
jgi:hypothetical protein